MPVTIYEYPNDFQTLVAEQSRAECWQYLQEVRCRDCFHFQRDHIGCGDGMGTCAAYCEDKMKHSLYPNIPHQCNQFTP